MSHKGPVNSIERFYKIKLEDKGFQVFRFDSMENFLSDPHQFKDIPAFEKAKLFNQERFVQKGLQTIGCNLSYEFVD